MSVTEVKRPNFYEGQYLGAADLVAAQEYQRQQDQRHRLAAHTWGIAAGLELEERPRPGGIADAVDVYIKPGYAVDGFGRSMVVLDPYKIPETLFAQFTFNAAFPTGEWVPIWLQYREQKTNLPRPGFAVCDVDEQGLRILETFQIIAGELTTSQQRSQISVAGKSLDAADEIPDGSVPYQAFPDNGQSARWLIRLGSVRWLAPTPPTRPVGHFVKSTTDADKQKAKEERQYIGVIAENVLAPDGKVRIRNRKNPQPLVPDTQDLLAVEGSLRVDGISHFRNLLITDNYLNIDSRNLNNGAPTVANGLGGPALTFGFLSFEGIASKRTAGGNQDGLDFYTSNAARLSITKEGSVGIGTTQPSQLLTLAAPEGTRLEIGRTSASLPWISSGEINPGSFVINQRSKGSSMPGADFALMRDSKKRVVLGDIDTYVSSQDSGSLRFFINQEEVGEIEALHINSFGNVGIGTQLPGAKLDVAGDVRITGNLTVGGLINGSDQRLKSNIVPLKNVLEKIQQIQGVSFDWNATYASLGYSTEGRQIGVLAQEVQRVFPELVTKWGSHDYLGLDYSRLSAVLVEAVKELAEQNAALSLRIEALEKRIAARKKRGRERKYEAET